MNNHIWFECSKEISVFSRKTWSIGCFIVKADLLYMILLIIYVSRNYFPWYPKCFICMTLNMLKYWLIITSYFITGKIPDLSNADISVDQYHRYEVGIAKNFEHDWWYPDKEYYLSWFNFVYHIKKWTSFLRLPLVKRVFEIKIYIKWRYFIEEIIK